MPAAQVVYLQPGSSRWARAWLAGIYLVAAGAILAAGLPLLWRLGLLLLVGLGYGLERQRRRRCAVRTAIWLASGRWWLADLHEPLGYAHLLRCSYVSRWLVILCWRLDALVQPTRHGCRGRRCCQIWADAVNATTWRRLQMRLNLQARSTRNVSKHNK